MASHRIEFCSESDLPELFERFADWYRFNPRMTERDYFDWQFKSAPFRLCGGEFDFLVLRDSRDAIVGGLGFVGFEVSVSGRVERAGWTHNWHGGPGGHGGLALHSRFTELVDRHFLLRINEQVQRIFALLDIPILKALPRWWAAVDAARAVDLFKVSDAGDRGILADSARKLAAIGAAPGVRRVARLDPADDFSFAHWPGIEGYARRSGTYLNWRYVDIPRHNYRILRSERGLGVYRVERVMGSDASVAHIVEWTFAAGEMAGALAAIVADPDFARPVLIDFHCTHAAIGRSLERFGFVEQEATAQPMPDWFRPANHSGGYAIGIDIPPHRTPRAFDFDRWYVTKGDGDLDRVKL